MPRWGRPLLFCVALCGCGEGGSLPDSRPTGGELAPIAALGKKIFEDPSLSASGTLACQTCHDPAHAHADTRAVSIGGVDMAQPGTRNAPSIRYLDQTPAFFFDDDGTPVGGFNRDGRADTLAQQARRPILSGNEMSNGSAQAFADRLRQATYANEFTDAFGAQIFDDAEATLDRATFAIERYELEDPKFHQYSSKYDDFLRGRAQLSEQEIRGLALFNSPQKGNCAACHPSGLGPGGALPLFTDFTYDNLGVPRNAAIAANEDPEFFDLGLCGPSREDLVARTDLCGAFKVPTLRNVAVTAPYFHNGRFATLKEVLQFYVRRDTNPEAFYPGDKFDDLPPALRGNVNTSEVPYDRKPGDAPRLSDDEVDDVIAFLSTLTDSDLQP